MKKILLILTALILLAGCGPQDSSSNQLLPSLPAEKQPAAAPQTLPPAATQGSSIQMETPTPPAAASSSLEGLIEEAKKDLAQKLVIPTDQISLAEAREVVWPDASLGCPQPGMLYIQVPEDGALILLRAQGVEFEYHSGGSRGLFLCEKVFTDPEKLPQIDITSLTPPSPDNGIPPGEDD